MLNIYLISHFRLPHNRFNRKILPNNNVDDSFVRILTIRSSEYKTFFMNFNRKILFNERFADQFSRLRQLHIAFLAGRQQGVIDVPGRGIELRQRGVPSSERVDVGS